MKTLFLVILATAFFPETGNAEKRDNWGRHSSNDHPDPAPRRHSSTTPCENTALNVADFIEKESWGGGKSYEPTTIGKPEKEGNNYEFKIKVLNDSEESKSDLTYIVNVTRNARQEACVVTSVETK